jgi:hypothetical protein
MSAKILTFNVDELADLYYDGRTIPFEADRFVAVTSLVTLEHIPIPERLAFLQECVRDAAIQFSSCQVSYKANRQFS